MRKLSCKWPLWLTLFAFAQPVFYVFFRIGKPEIFNTMELANKAAGGLGIAIIVWLVYGVACLFASPKSDTPAKSSQSSGDFQTEIDEDKAKDEQEQ